jgi:hypothetical protein
MENRLRSVRLRAAIDRHGGLCCGHSAAIKPCAFGAPLQQEEIALKGFAGAFTLWSAISA